MEQLHVAFASLAILIGALQVLRRRRDALHRLTGRAWVAAMAITALSSFFLQDMTGGFSYLHGLSGFILLCLALGVARARQGRFAEHALFMINSWGGLVTAGWMAAARHGLELPGMTHGIMLAGFWVVLAAATLPLYRQAFRGGGRAGPHPADARGPEFLGG